MSSVLRCYGCQGLATEQMAGALVGRRGNEYEDSGDTVGNLGCSWTVGSVKIPGESLRWILPVDQVAFARRLESRRFLDYGTS